LVLTNLYPLHQRPYNLALLAPLDIIETVVEGLPKRFEVPNDQVEVLL
jgi:hypothetical protein